MPIPMVVREDYGFFISHEKLFYTLTMEGVKERITEKRNFLTEKVDASSPLEMLCLFDHSDSQMFTGFENYKSIYSEKMITSLCNFSDVLCEEIGKGKRVVFGGSGTSGRIGWLCSRMYNKCCGGESFGYLIAGGDKALIVSQEAYEDDAVLGSNELDKSKPGVCVGISCGLSAPYVAGMMHYGLENKIPSVLVGFNPVHLARNTKIWENGSFLDISLRMEEDEEKSGLSVVLNPVVGPEPITGSSRMKGGSMTKIILDTAFATSQFLIRQQVSSSPPEEKGKRKLVQSFLMGFEKTYRQVYMQNRSKIARVSEACGKCLCEGGSVYYIGVGVLGIWGIIDASECVPTYGAKHSDIRGFVVGGWKVMHNKSDMSTCEQENQFFRISVEEFKNSIMPNLKSSDIIIFLGMETQEKKDLMVIQSILSEYNSIPQEKKTKYGPFLIWASSSSEKQQQQHQQQQIELYPLTEFMVDLKEKDILLPENVLEYELSSISIIPNLPSYGAFCMKLVLNFISTTAHVMKGTTVSNIMVNMKLSNSKLLNRATNMISSFCGVSEEIARNALLNVVHRGEPHEGMTVREHIIKAAKLDKVIPKAMLLVTKRCTDINEAEKILREQPVLRNVIKKLFV